jgi:RHS repeat-associated protein
LPTAYTVGGGGALCEGGAGAPITLSGSQTGVNYQLQLDGINTGSSVAGTGAAISFPAQISAGTYTVNATYASTGCTKTMTENAVITIKPVVVPTITGPAKLTGASITLSIATTTGHTYQWRRDGDNISGAATSWIAVTTTGSYDVVVTASNGCSRTTSAYQVTKDLTPYYNGNIAAVRWRTDKPYGSAEPDYTGMYTFTFDEEYQIKDATWATPDFVSNDFTYNGNKFRLSDLTYDANGNILSMRRYDKNGTRTNNFTYTYEPNKNKLQSVSGYVAAYGYDAIGQTTVVDKVEAGKDQYIDYDVSGKVIRVYGDPAKTPSSLKVENIYDERGLRIGKIDHVAQKTTWYMHDATGRVMNIFEQQGIAATNNVNPVVNTEVPIYGAFKIGAMYPQLEGSTDYEVADHLGNVRALVKDNVTIYTATMEDTEIPDITNPRVEEMAYFENLFETEQSDAFMNHSPAIPGIVDAPSMVAYLNWNDNTGTQAADRAVGPSIALEVKAGETITAEVWTRYEEKTSFTKDFGLVALSSLLGNTFVSLPGFENLTVAQASSNLAGALTAAGFPDDGVDGTRPFAYLNYIIYDANMVYQDAGWVRVTEEAGSQPAELYLPQNKPIRLSFDTPITIRENGFIYIWVSNQSKDTRVWFDDLKVSHHEPWVTQATDYGVWGDILRQQKTDSHFYRYAFQGDFSEKDPETGWNHFEAREYDPVTGRWLTMDPARQFPSPYAAFANNPIIRVDPDGKIIPLIAAYLIRRALIECGKRFIINAGLDALAQFSANVIKANDYSWDGMVNAFKDVDWGDAAAEGLSGTIKITGNSKTAKVMKVAIPVLTEFMKAGLDYKGLQDDPTFQKVRSVLVEKGYPSATVDLVAGLTSKLAGFLSEELGGGGAAKWNGRTIFG